MAALPGLQFHQPHVGLLVVLDAVQAVENDHALVKFQFVGLKFGVVAFAS